jgi:hypothetical protein
MNKMMSREREFYAAYNELAKEAKWSDLTKKQQAGWRDVAYEERKRLDLHAELMAQQIRDERREMREEYYQHRHRAEKALETLLSVMEDLLVNNTPEARERAAHAMTAAQLGRETATNIYKTVSTGQREGARGADTPYDPPAGMNGPTE